MDHPTAVDVEGATYTCEKRVQKKIVHFVMRLVFCMFASQLRQRA